MSSKLYKMRRNEIRNVYPLCRQSITSIAIMKSRIGLSWLALLTIFAPYFMVTGYLNPILPGVNPDPSILRTGSDYWLIVSSFEFMPGIPIYHSTDLVNWSLHSHALTRPSQLSLYNVPQSLGMAIKFHTLTNVKTARKSLVLCSR